MDAMEQPRIGNRCDAIELLERLIEIAGANKELVLGLEALKDVIVREAI